MELLDRQLASSLTEALSGGQIGWPLLMTLIGGLLTAFTPCVYPLIPVTLRYFGGARSSGSGPSAFALAVAYVTGMALLYATLGTAFASFGVVFGSFLSNPWVVVAIACFCLAMAVSMLGVFSLQLPVGLNTRLSQVGGRTLGGAVAMGAVSGLIAAPCTGPILAVILALIASTGELLLGFFLMLSFSIGLGIPFLFLALFSSSLSKIPSSGTWMEVVKLVLATAMVVVAYYFLSFVWQPLTLLGEQFSFVLGALTALALIVGLLVALRGGAWPSVKWVKLAAALVAGVGLASLLVSASPVATGEYQVRWTYVGSSVSRIEAVLAKARAASRPVMIDFTADWCAACKELDHKTYNQEAVVDGLARFSSVKIDATKTGDDIDWLFERYGVLGLPTVLFISSGGFVLQQPRVTGFVGADAFVKLLEQVR